MGGFSGGGNSVVWVSVCDMAGAEGKCPREEELGERVEAEGDGRGSGSGDCGLKARFEDARCSKTGESEPVSIACSFAEDSHGDREISSEMAQVAG